MAKKEEAFMCDSCENGKKGERGHCDGCGDNACGDCVTYDGTFCAGCIGFFQKVENKG